MPNLKLNINAVNELKKAGLFDIWLVNFKMQWNNKTNCSGVGDGGTIKKIESLKTGAGLIYWGFSWYHSSLEQDSVFWSEAFESLGSSESETLNTKW